MSNYEINLLIRDEQGRSTTRKVLATVADEATLLTELSTYIPAYQALTKCAIISYTYSMTVNVGNSPAVGSNIDAGATIRWDTPLAVNPTSNVPDPVEALKSGTGSLVITDPIFSAWYALYNPGNFRVNVNNFVQPLGVLSALLDK